MQITADYGSGRLIIHLAGELDHHGAREGMEWTEFYPTGVHEAVFQNPELCRKRLVRTGFLSHDPNSRCDAVLYYNNGAKKREGKMQGTKWLQYTEFLNTGIEVPSEQQAEEPKAEEQQPKPWAQ